MTGFWKTRARLTALAMGVLIVGSSAAGAVDSPLSCGFGNVALLLRSVRGIECTANRTVKVTGAMLNGGACEDPVKLMSRMNLEAKRSGSPDFASLRDFRKTYAEGAKFIVAVPTDCDLTSYTISIDGYDLTWPVR